MNKTPSKYVPEDRNWEKKRWLQEKYWGKLLSGREISKQCDVSKGVIYDQLDKFDIPRRTKGYTRENSISPFTGFYRNKAARTDKRSIHQYESGSDYGTDNKNLNWQKAARREDHISDDAILKS